MTDTKLDSETPLEKKLDDLYDLVGEVEIAMFTTRRPDGSLVTRPMATQKHQPVADFWFVTDRSSDKVDELAADPHVSLAYYNSKTWEWVSVTGTVRISQDRALIRQLYQPDWKAWFGEGDDAAGEDGSPDDPRFALLLVDAQSVLYGKKNKSTPFALFELAKGLLKGEQPDLQDVRHVSEQELR
jgi:general stress protein 26